MKRGSTILRCVACLLSLTALALVVAAICRRGVGLELLAALVCCVAGLGALLWANRRDGV